MSVPYRFVAPELAPDSDDWRDTIPAPPPESDPNEDYNQAVSDLVRAAQWLNAPDWAFSSRAKAIDAAAKAVMTLQALTFADK